MMYAWSNKKHKRQNANTSGCNWKQELSSYGEKESTHDEMHLGRDFSAFRDAEASHCSSQGRKGLYRGLGSFRGSRTAWYRYIMIDSLVCCLSKEWRVTIPASRFVLFNDLRSISQVPSELLSSKCSRHAQSTWTTMELSTRDLIYVIND